MGVINPPFNPKNGIAGVFNYDPQFLYKYRIAREKAVENVADCKILEIGDSTTAGSTGATLQARTPLYRVGSLLQAAGLPVSFDQQLGKQWAGTSGCMAGSTPAGWSANTGVHLAGAALTGSSGGAWSFTPALQVDTFDIYYLQLSGGGTFSWAVDGGAATNVNTTGSNAVQKLTVSAGALGTHTLALTAISSNAYLCGVCGRNSTTKRIQVWEAGIAGQPASRFSGNVSPWDGLPSITNFAPDLMIVNLTINDAIANTAQATYESQLTSIVQAGQASGSVILRVANFITTSQASQAAQDAKRQSVKTVATAQNCVVIDIPARWGPYTGTANLTVGADGVHPNDVGYGDIARAVTEILLK